jgi:ABC-type branched-subunit amino acid transport system ATPase component/ABC-type branched-subunit amino acid transport system permease subunit
MAALAGIFLAEETSTLSAQQLTLFIVEAFAAAIIGRLRSLPLTMIGGLIVGLALSLNANFLTLTPRWSTAAPAIPFIVLFLALLFAPQARIEGRRMLNVVTPRVLRLRSALIGFLLLFVAVLLLAGVGIDRIDLRRLTLAVLTMLGMLSLVPLIGWSGQISLAHITFVGVGAWANLEFTKDSATSVFGLGLYHAGSPWGLVVAAIVAVPFGLLMALPALRLKGLYLALASMAFALMAKPLFFDQPEVFGASGRQVAPIKAFGFSFDQPFDVLGIHFGQDAAFLLLAAALLGAVGMAVVALRRGPFGRRLIAMRDSPAASATLGVNLFVTKLAVFALSAAIAGFAGALLAIHLGSAGTRDFELLSVNGLPWLLLVVLGGVSVVSGAVLGGFLYQFIFFIADKVTLVIPLVKIDLFTINERIGPGLLGIGIGRQPEGIVPEVGHDIRERRAKADATGEPPNRSGNETPSLDDAPLTREPVPTASRTNGEAQELRGSLEVRDVAVRFGGVQALTDVTLDVQGGQVTGLIGPNGAGKTTLFNVITGLQPADTGSVLIGDHDITLEKPHRRARLGISRTFQRLETFGTMSVRDNVLVAAETRRRWSRDGSDSAQVADRAIDRVGLRHVVSERVDRLPTGTARLVEVARSLASQPKVLLLDEPSAGLNESETIALGSLLRSLAAEGLAVLLVEHDMSFVMGTCDRIHVLDFGRTIAAGSPVEIQADPTVRAAYLGSATAAPASKTTAPVGEQVTVSLSAILEDREPEPMPAPATSPGDCSLAFRNVRARYGAIDVLFDVNLSIVPGQVYALLGPNGAGKSTTLQVASGQVQPVDGEVWVHGEKITGRSTDTLAREGLCLVPEGRGIFPNMTVTENLRMATYTGTPLQQVLDRSFERFPRLAERRKQVAGTLSGGEQQMLSMARALATDPKLLLIDELSMGLAPLIVEELYEVVKRIADDDVSILIVEQFAHEVLGVADVAAIMLRGRIAYEGDPREVGEALQSAYLGGAIEA